MTLHIAMSLCFSRSVIDTECFVLNMNLTMVANRFNGSLCGSRGGTGVQGVRTPRGTPLKYKNIGFLSNTGPDALKTHKATKPAFNAVPPSARQQNAI